MNVAADASKVSSASNAGYNSQTVIQPVKKRHTWDIQ